MGGGSYNPDHYQRTVNQVKTQVDTGAYFAKSKADTSDLIPSKWKNGVREALDRGDGSTAVPIIIGLDVTGSMAEFPKYFVTTGLGVLLTAISASPLENPQIALAGIGDMFSDTTPFQMTQFESDPTKLVEAARHLYLEGGGGGNGSESYSLALYATTKVKRSAATRDQKGFLFIIGDDGPDDAARSGSLSRTPFTSVFPNTPLMDKDVLLEVVRQQWHVFYIAVRGSQRQYEIRQWKDYLGDTCVVSIDNADSLAPVVSALINATCDVAPDTIISQWEDNAAIAIAVKNALVTASGNTVQKRGSSDGKSVRL